MNTVEKAVETQMNNIQSRTGKTMDELYAFIRASGLTRHGEIRDLLKRELGLGHGDAHMLAQVYLNPATLVPQAGESVDDNVLDEIYSGPKAALRPLHDAVMAAIQALGPFEIAPKKGYLSLRRKRQFAMLGPASKGRVEVGLNMKDIPPTERLQVQPPGGMCQYKVFVSTNAEVDAELSAWLRTAYDKAG